MVPGKIFHHVLASGHRHFGYHLGMSIKMFDRTSNGIDISRWHDNTVNAVTDDVAGFTRSALRLSVTGAS